MKNYETQVFQVLDFGLKDDLSGWNEVMYLVFLDRQVCPLIYWW